MNDGMGNSVGCRIMFRKRSSLTLISPAAVLVDRLLPDDVVRARDGELAAEPDLGRGNLLVADHAVHHDVVRAARLVQRHRRLAVVQLAERKRGRKGRSEEFEAFGLFHSDLP